MSVSDTDVAGQASPAEIRKAMLSNPDATPPTPPIDAEYIPDELKALRRWIVWRWEWRDDRWTKPPINPRTGKPCSVTSPSSWTTFAEALGAHQAGRHNTAGLGFVLANDGYVGIDIDGCRYPDACQLEPWAEDIARLFPRGLSRYPDLWEDDDEDVVIRGAFAEPSPTATGVKIITRGTWTLAGSKFKLPGDGEVEVYTSGRYFTVTGNWPQSYVHEITNQQTGLDRLADLVQQQEQQAKPRPTRQRPAGNAPATAAARNGNPLVSRVVRAGKPPELMTDAEALDLARRIYPDFDRLWNGDTSGHGHNHSSADLALANMLRFVAGRDPARIDSLFRRSRLMRPKWTAKHHADGRTYGEGTIAAAMNGEVYDPCYRNGTAAGQAEPPGSAGPDGEAIHRTDVGNARRFALWHGDDLRHCAPWEKWLCYDGTRWRIDEQHEVTRLAKQVPKRIFDEAVAEMQQLAKDRDAMTEDEKDKALSKLGALQRMQKWAITSEARARIDALIGLARSEPGIPILPDELDADPWLFNCMNGTIDLGTGELRPHERGDHVTSLSPVVYDPNATAPRWERFLEEIFPGPDGRPDQDLIAYLARLVGYTLVGEVTEHILAILWGDGANGKSVFINAIRQALGTDYAAVASPELLLEKRGTRHPTEIANLYRRRMLVCQESGQGRHLDEGLVKWFTGGDRLQGRRCQEDFWEFDPTHTLFLVTNHKPEIRGQDEGIWRRLHLVPFVRTFAKHEQDKALPATLRDEASGILAWAIRGCLEWQRIGLEPPTTVVRATAEYRHDEDTIDRFLCDRCVIGDDHSVGATDLWVEFNTWQHKTQEVRYRSQKAFSQGFLRAIAAHTDEGVRRITKDKRSTMVYQGLRIKEGPKLV